jgi:hypothetical protein
MLLLLLSPLVTVSLRNRTWNLWQGLIEPTHYIIRACRVLLLLALLNFMVILVWLIIFKRFSSTWALASQQNVSNFFQLILSLSILFSLGMFSYSVFGPKAMMPEKTFEFLENPYRIITAKWKN